MCWGAYWQWYSRHVCTVSIFLRSAAAGGWGQPILSRKVRNTLLCNSVGRNTQSSLEKSRHSFQYSQQALYVHLQSSLLCTHNEPVHRWKESEKKSCERGKKLYPEFLDIVHFFLFLWVVRVALGVECIHIIAVLLFIARKYLVRKWYDLPVHPLQELTAFYPSWRCTGEKESVGKIWYERSEISMQLKR